MKEFLKQVNPESLVELKDAKLEASLSTAKPMDRFQFERNGFFVCDKYSPDGGPLVFNRTIGLSLGGLSREEDDKSKERSRKEEQEKQKAKKEAMKLIDPRQMFRSQADLYSKFDEDGIPTHDAQGEP